MGVEKGQTDRIKAIVAQRQDRKQRNTGTCSGYVGKGKRHMQNTGTCIGQVLVPPSNKKVHIQLMHIQVPDRLQSLQIDTVRLKRTTIIECKAQCRHKKIGASYPANLLLEDINTSGIVPCPLARAHGNFASIFKRRHVALPWLLYCTATTDVQRGYQTRNV
jgi:hypothetical protein